MSVPDSIVARLAAGEPVSPAELVEAEAVERLVDAQAVLDAHRAEVEAERRWLVAADDAIATFAAEADDVIGRLCDALDTFEAQRDPLQALQMEADDVIRRGVDSLYRMGYPVSSTDIYATTGGRVRIDPEMLRTHRSQRETPWAPSIRGWLDHAATRTDFPRR